MSCGKLRRRRALHDGERLCNTNFCAQGVCCSTACAGTCASCALTGSVGTCASVPAGTGSAEPVRRPGRGDVRHRRLVQRQRRAAGSTPPARPASPASCTDDSTLTPGVDLQRERRVRRRRRRRRARRTPAAAGACKTDLHGDHRLQRRRPTSASARRARPRHDADREAEGRSDGDAVDLDANIQITNNGTTAIPMSDLTVRYWYTYDTTPIVDAGGPVQLRVRAARAVHEHLSELGRGQSRQDQRRLLLPDGVCGRGGQPAMRARPPSSVSGSTRTTGPTSRRRRATTRTTARRRSRRRPRSPSTVSASSSTVPSRRKRRRAA